MAYQFPDKTSFPRLRDYTAQVIGGCKARPDQLGTQVASWQATKVRVVELRSQREGANDAALEASTGARVEDVQFDVDLGGASAKSFELSGKDASKTPYVELFGKDDARTVKGYGPVKAVAAAGRIVKDGRRLKATEAASIFAERAAELLPALDRLEASTGRLGAAATRVADAKDALFAPRQAKKKLVADLNALIAVTEAAILTAFPGRDDIVSAILLPWFERRAPKPKAGVAKPPSPDPLAPDLEDEDQPDTEP